MNKYDLIVLPVVNEKGELVGRITIDDVVDVIKEEAEKDYQMASGISKNIESSDTILDLTKARIPWLFNRIDRWNNWRKNYSHFFRTKRFYSTSFYSTNRCNGWKYRGSIGCYSSSRYC